MTEELIEPTAFYELMLELEREVLAELADEAKCKELTDEGSFEELNFLV